MTSIPSCGSAFSRYEFSVSSSTNNRRLRASRTSGFSPPETPAVPYTLPLIVLYHSPSCDMSISGTKKVSPIKTTTPNDSIQTVAEIATVNNIVKLTTMFDAVATVLEEWLPESKPPFVSDEDWAMLQNKNFVKMEDFSDSRGTIHLKIPQIYEVILHSFFARGPELKSCSQNKGTRFRWWRDYKSDVLDIANKRIRETTLQVMAITLPNSLKNDPILKKAWVEGETSLKKELTSIFRSVVDGIGSDYQAKKMMGPKGRKKLNLPRGVKTFEQHVDNVIENRYLTSQSFVSETSFLSIDENDSEAIPFHFPSEFDDEPPALAQEEDYTDL